MSNEHKNGSRSSDPLPEPHPEWHLCDCLDMTAHELRNEIVALKSKLAPRPDEARKSTPETLFNHGLELGILVRNAETGALGIVQKVRLRGASVSVGKRGKTQYWQDPEIVGRVVPCSDNPTSETPELLALREVEKAAFAYVPYPALTFDERHAPRREALLIALANVIKARKDSPPAKGSRPDSATSKPRKARINEPCKQCPDCECYCDCLRPGAATGENK